KDCSCMSQLHGGCQHIALADTENDGFSRIPGLVPAPLLPFRRRQQSFKFAADVDTGSLAETEMTNEVCHRLDAHFMRQAIEKCVAGDGDGFAHIYDPVALWLPVTVAMAVARQCEEPRIIDTERR